GITAGAHSMDKDDVAGPISTLVFMDLDNFAHVQLAEVGHAAICNNSRAAEIQTLLEVKRTPGEALAALVPTRLTMYGPAVRCKKTSPSWDVRSCINVCSL